MIKINKISSIEEYLSFERASLTKNEYLFEAIIPMAGATIEHNIISGNLFALIWLFLKNQKSLNIVFQSDMRTFNPSNNSFMYPDVVVSDGKPVLREDGKMDNLINPILIIEVLSKSTAVYDKTDKFIACKSIPSLKEYVLVSTDTPEIEIYRKENDTHWELVKQLDLTKLVQFKSINLEFALSEIYDNRN